MTARLLLDLPEEDYHADPCETPSLSNSIANVLVDRTPFRAWTLHPRLGGQKREPTAALDRGTLIHKLVLGKGAEIDVLKYDSFRTNAAKEARDNAREAGLLPVLEAKFEEAEKVAAYLVKKLAALDPPVEFTGVSEATILWEEPVEGGGTIECRARLDHLLEAEGVIYDLKTTRDLDPELVERSVASYGYHTQHAAYTSALSTLHPELDGRVRFELLFVEPHLHGDVMSAPLDGAFRELGQRRWSEACEAWGRCLREKKWPGHPRPVTLSMPGWLRNREGLH